jgi:hypothetical protein
MQKTRIVPGVSAVHYTVPTMLVTVPQCESVLRSNKLSFWYAIHTNTPFSNGGSVQPIDNGPFVTFERIHTRSDKE